MNMKNATILLIFLLCILGLIIGVYYTEVSDGAKNADEYESMVYFDSNNTITIHVDKKGNDGDTFTGFFT